MSGNVSLPVKSNVNKRLSLRQPIRANMCSQTNISAFSDGKKIVGISFVIYLFYNFVQIDGKLSPVS